MIIRSQASAVIRKILHVWKNHDADAIIPLIRTKKMSKIEWIVDFKI